MNKRAKKKLRGPYKCTICREYGHRADVCPKKRKAETILNTLPGHIAIALIPEQIQLLSIINEQTHAGLQGAIEGNQRLAESGKAHNDSLINAWTELAKRQAKIPKRAIERAREAHQKRLTADRDYEAAIAPIIAVLQDGRDK
jgi:hypothetical protein